MEIGRFFTRHPESVGETYFVHLCTACRFGFRMVWAGIACMIHAVLPFLFERTGSDCIRELHDCMTTRRSSAALPVSSRMTRSGIH